MKFDMGNATLSSLSKETDGSHTDLGGLVTALVNAVEPLEGKFNGAGRVAFDNFKRRADDITLDLNGALSAILGGQAGMDQAFNTGDTDAQDNATRQQGQANFEAASFGASRA